jgi:hypothetical protein
LASLIDAHFLLRVRRLLPSADTRPSHPLGILGVALEMTPVAMSNIEIGFLIAVGLIVLGIIDLYIKRM